MKKQTGAGSATHAGNPAGPTTGGDGPILLYEHEGTAHRVHLGPLPLLVGRDAGADVRIADRSLSGRHCRLEPLGQGAWKVVDLGSRNGTYVNGRVIEQRRLVDGDRVRLGRVELRFLASSAAEELLGDVDGLVDRVYERLGGEGLREAAARFAGAAGRHGIADLLPESDALRAAERTQTVLRAMIEERKPEAVFDLLLDSLIEFTGAERGFFVLHETPPGKKREPKETATRRIVAARGMGRESVQDASAKLSRTVEQAALERGEPILVTDAELDDRFLGTESIVDLQLRSILAVPVPGADGPVGVLVLDHRFERGLFLERHLPQITLFANQAAVALRNATLHAENERRLQELAASKCEVEELNRILKERVAQTSAELHEVREHVLRERDEAPLKYSYVNMIAKSRPMRDVFRLLDKVTDGDVPVLIQGESGTGKELVARALHFNGPRKNGPFVSENCAAIPETLLESELFGYTKGAFTGANADRKGLFESANGGTIFLDEIGDMPLDMQKKLLRVLQEGEVRRVGGRETVRLDVRVVAASNQDLLRLSKEGRFREDLYYRLNVVGVHLPPLRDRREDIPLLVEHFLAEATRGGPPKVLNDEAMKALEAYGWPGNVRELRNEVFRAAALSERVILPLVLGPQVREGWGRTEERECKDLGSKPLKDMVREVVEDLERQVVRAALVRSGGRKAGAARLLGVSRPTLDAKIEAYKLSTTP